MTDFPTIESYIGQTPLVKLQRLPLKRSNTILAKLEGNNPAGSVKDRPAMSMIARAQARGDISPGDTSGRDRARGHRAVHVHRVRLRRGLGGQHARRPVLRPGRTRG
ncbi:MAG: pyridoxal-phosphate dependent enzyme, partial [Pseudomonadota bacterium]